MDGVVNLLKTAGMTSHDAVYFLRRITGEKHIGHTGTLDPQASGVLTLCLGNATRYIEYMEGNTKAYRCEFTLGVETESGDIWGQERTEIPVDEFPSEEEVVRTLEAMTGIQEQLPPAFSAIKVHGVKLYKLARRGQEIPEVAPRKVEIHSLDLIRYNRNKGVGTFDCLCSKGTYIRTVCEELGKRLGTGGCMSHLIRTEAGPFTLADTHTIEEIEANAGCPERFMLPMGVGMENLGSIRLKSGRDVWFQHGGYLVKSDYTDLSEPKDAPKANIHHNHTTIRTGAKIYRVYAKDGRFVGTARWDDNELKYMPDKVLAHV